MTKKQKKTINVRVADGTPDWWNQEAAKNGYLYANGGNPGKFFRCDRIWRISDNQA